MHNHPAARRLEEVASPEAYMERDGSLTTDRACDLAAPRLRREGRKEGRLADGQI